MAMTADINSDSESDIEDTPFEKITINTDYKIKTSFEEPPTYLKLKPLPDNLEYVFLEEPSFLPVIISSQLSKEKKNKLVSVLKKHKQAFSWKTTDIPSICPSFCKHKIQLLDDKKTVVQKQRSPWVSSIHCVPKKGGITVVTNENDELVPTRIVTGWRKCGYKKDNCELNYKFLNNLQPEWKQYGTLMRQTKNLMDINIDALYNILKQNLRDVNDALGYKKKAVVVTSDPLALVAEKTKVSTRKVKVVVSLDSKGSEFVKSDDKKVEKKDDEKKRDMSKVKCYNCKKEGHFAKDCKKAKVKDYNYYRTKMLLAKKDSDEKVLLAQDQAWMESSSDSDKEINANMVFMAQIEKTKVLHSMKKPLPR
nr:DNA-directed DNA polymerase [Tanacetum cinerariifolium]